MTILFGIGAAVWFASVAAMFLSRALRNRKTQVFQASVVMCGVGSVILAITTPAVNEDSAARNVLFSIMFVAMAILCACAILMLRRRSVED